METVDMIEVANRCWDLGGDLVTVSQPIGLGTTFSLSDFEGCLRR